MEYPVLVILSVLAVGVLLVVVPVVLTTLSENREPKAVACPVTRGLATITVDAGRAARTAAFGRMSLSVAQCSLWPEREGCAQGCLRSPAEEAAPSAPSAAGQSL
jgi:hypothetical protein